MLCPRPPAPAPPLPLVLVGRQPQPEGTRTRRRDHDYICCCRYAFSLLTLLISFSPPRFVSAVALAQYLPDPISLPLCFAPDVSTFSLNSTSASLFFPHCLFHLLITALTQCFPWLSHECSFLFLPFYLEYFLFIFFLLHFSTHYRAFHI